MAKKEQRDPLRERSVVLVKPDGVRRGLIGSILNRFEKAGLKIISMRMVRENLQSIVMILFGFYLL